MTLEQYENLNPRCEVVHDGVKMVFCTPSTVTLWRVQTIYEKEPCTLDWIASFQPGEVLLDCGANVGMYTVWAAATRNMRVVALEPESQNYAVLNRNIRANGLTDRVKAYCMGLSDCSGLFEFHMADMRVGGSNHALGEALNFELKKLSPHFVPGGIGFALDDLVERGAVPVPNHVKIDVDGFEHKVIAGARKTLRNPALKSLLIETNQNLPEHRAMVAELTALGFGYDMGQVRRAERQAGDFKGVAEYVFRR